MGKAASLWLAAFSFTLLLKYTRLSKTQMALIFIYFLGVSDCQDWRKYFLARTGGLDTIPAWGEFQAAEESLMAREVSLSG